MLFPGITRFADLGFLFIRLIVGAVFITSGWNDLRAPEARSKSIGMPKSFTLLLGGGEVLGGIGVVLGVLTQLAALGLILIGLGAIRKKAFVWKTGFWGEKASGWHYDLMLMSMNLAIVFTNGGSWGIWK